MGKVLIVEDSPDLRMVLRDVVTKEGHTVFAAGTGAEALALARSQVLDLVFLDIGLPDINGIELISSIQQLIPDVDVVMLTALNDARSAVESLKSGAGDYILKPFDLLEFRKLLNRLWPAGFRPGSYRIDSREKDRFGGLLGQQSGHGQFAPADRHGRHGQVPGVDYGETGTGKELVARALQRRSGNGVFVKVDCGTLSASIIEAELFGYEKGAFTDARETRKGLVEVADGGILFLDEIGNLPLALQPKVLRLIEESVFRRVGGVQRYPGECPDRRRHQYQRRGGSPPGAVPGGSLLSAECHDPGAPRRCAERQDDILLLADHYLRFFAAEMNKPIRGFTPEAEEILRSYDFPGNVRELKNLVERAVIYCRVGTAKSGWSRITPAARWNSSRSSRPAKNCCPLGRWKSAISRQVLDATGQNKSRAAKISGYFPHHPTRQTYRLIRF